MHDMFGFLFFRSKLPGLDHHLTRDASIYVTRRNRYVGRNPYP